MALLPTTKDTIIDEDVFKDTVRLSRSEALMVQKQLVKEWEPAREVWPLKYGSAIIGLSSSFSSLMINGLFRRKLRLRSTGQFLTTFALVAAPAAFGTLAHDVFITDNILTYANRCPICYELKSSLMLNTFAILYPLILSPTINLGIAGSVGIRTPYIYEIKELSKFWWNVVKPALNNISIAFCLNSVLAAVIVHKQLSTAQNMANIIQQIEKHSSEKLQ